MLMLMLICALHREARAQAVVPDGGEGVLNDAYVAAASRYIALKESPWRQRRAAAEHLAGALEHLNLAAVGSSCSITEPKIRPAAQRMWRSLPRRLRNEQPLYGALGEQCDDAHEGILRQPFLALHPLALEER